ncbi:MAG: serine/threonine protein kinase [Planctomycetaceae bacterium]|nr:serine/threonine protein kinase [Planctomycetaceae bacterium]
MSNISEVTATRRPSARSVYCVSCNGRFYVRLGDPVCPECGLAAGDEPDLGDLAPTLLLRVSTGGMDGEIPGSELRFETQTDGEHAIDSELGRNLHVYEFGSLLGAGGMGRVYLARHTHLDRRCAVKVLSPRAAKSDIDYVQRFQQEGRAAAALNHPNIVVTHAIGDERGYHFLEMEYIAGGSLRQLLRDEGPLPPLRATNLVARIADGLASAHRRGIVHRDLKPDNVMMTLSGVPKITDFGLAKRVHTNLAGEAGYLAGTPHFMAPELFSGAAASTSSDVYALGVMYFVLLTGRLPFTAAKIGELKRAVQEDAFPNPRELVPELPLEMAECLALLLEKCPANRPANAAAAAQLLAAVAGEVPDIETLLTVAFSGRSDVSWTRDGERYTLRIMFRDGRKQDVTVEPSLAASSEKLLVISSICGPAEPTFYEEALRTNAVMSHGSITIRDIDDQAMFCATNSYPRETADPEEVRRSVFELAHRADAIERLLTNQDRH